MEIKEMRELPAEELRTEATKAREKIWKMRFQAKGEPLENAGALRGLKKDLARLLTVLRRKELDQERARRRGRGASSPGSPQGAGAAE
jgi:large subunit ribosomal protein L29